MSDWGGTNSTAESLKAGLALEMPGTARYYSERAVKAAIATGKLSEEVIDQRVNEILNLIALTGKFDNKEPSPERAVVDPEHSELIREAGAQGIVLLKNENDTLPLQPSKVKKMAVLGLAKQCLAHGGGSASVNAHYKISPYEALDIAFGGDTELLYAEGAHMHRTLPVLSEHIFDLQGTAGFTMTKYNLQDPLKIDSVTTIESSRYMSPGQAPSSRVVIEGTYTPEESGHHKLELSSIGVATLYIDGELVMGTQGSTVDPVSFLQGNAGGQRISFSFKQGTSYNIKVELKLSANTSGFLLLQGVMGVSLGLTEQAKAEEDLLTPAVEAAKNADVTIVFVGNTNAWESEGRDMESMNLPANGSQDALISAVADVNPNTIVVNSTGVPIAMPWLSKVKVVLQTWFPGQEAGNSIVDILTGAVSPSGRLPVTFPRRLEDAPAYGNFPGDTEKLEVNYAEGSFIGYRHFDHSPETVSFHFGHGLSYTTFAFDKAAFSTSTKIISQDSESGYIATINVTNTGDVNGSEVVQVYLTPPSNATDIRTQRKLVGFEKLVLHPGETKSAHVAFAQIEFLEWDEGKSRWSVAAGEHLVELSTSAAKADVKATFTFKIEEDCVTSRL
jgi:beta-glucosidase